MDSSELASMLNISSAQAAKLLADNGGDINAALDAFEKNPSLATATPTVTQARGTGQYPGSESAPSSSSRNRVTGLSGPSTAPNPTKSTGGGARIARLSDLSHGDGEREEHFTGGGQAVSGARRAVFDAARNQGASENENYDDSATTKIEIIFYRDGFAIRTNGELGPLRDPQNPENRKFLEEVKNGQIPSELRGLGKAINASLVDEHTKDYTPPPKRPPPAFSGGGMVLGAAGGAAGGVGAGVGVGVGGVANDSAPQDVVCDPSKPSTRVQFRFADGTRVVGTFNLTHTRADLYNFLRITKPNQPAFVLSTTHPKADLPYDNITLEAANLTNAVVIQRLA